MTQESANFALPRALGAKLPWIALVAIIAGALALMLYRLGSCDLCKGNEAVEAIFVQQMVEHGEVLFPLENGGSPMYKPPLFHWTATAIDRLLGIKRVNAFNFRLPSALYTVAGVALTMGFAYAIMSIDAAILAGLTLLGAHQYIRLGRAGRVDMTLTFFETLALFAFWWWIDSWQGKTSDRRRHTGAMLYLLGAAMGFAVLAKGPVGALLPGLSMVIFLALHGRLREAIRRLSPIPVLLAIFIGSSWYLACYFGERHDFLSRQIGSENFGRFFGSLGSSPPWFYLGPLLFNSLPLSLLVPIAVYAALFATATARKEGEGTERDPRAAHAVRLLAIFWLVTVSFFSLAAYKSRWYLLPLWPSSAVILGWWVRRISSPNGEIWQTAFAAVCVAVATFNLIYIPRQEAIECARYSYRSTAEEIRRLVNPEQPLYAAGFGDEDFAPLLFYLDRSAPFVSANLSEAPSGYIIVPAQLWQAQKNHADGFEPILESTQGRRKPVLLRHSTNPTAPASTRGSKG